MRLFSSSLYLERAISASSSNFFKLRDFKTYTCERESNAETTSKLGFSVVAQLRLSNLFLPHEAVILLRFIKT